jgi:phosphoglycerate dehydrogenase-like enzyme
MAPMLFLGLYTAEYERTFVPDELRQVMSRFGRYERYDCSSKDPPSPQELLRRLAPADVALTGWPTPRFPEALVDLPDRRLKYICHLAGAVGYFLPRRYLEAGILCTNWGDRGIWPFAEGALALMLACLKATHRIGRHMRTSPGTAFPFPHPSPTLRGKRVGFVGYGAIARTLTGMLRPMLCRFGVYDPYAQDLPEGVGRWASLEDLFAESDIITLHCGLTPETTGMIGRDLLERMKPHAICINTARGKVVREGELIEFLRRRPDVTAGLDVFETEPLPADSPLPHMDNVICYPHCVGGGNATFSRLAAEAAARNLQAFCTGQPLQYVITPEKYDRMT